MALSPSGIPSPRTSSEPLRNCRAPCRYARAAANGRPARRWCPATQRVNSTPSSSDPREWRRLTHVELGEHAVRRLRRHVVAVLAVRDQHLRARGRGRQLGQAQPQIPVGEHRQPVVEAAQLPNELGPGQHGGGPADHVASP